ncbi:hypothetical protein A3K93_00435 [Acinetobacter sp. NCu2D-2]|uniref:hypothetical protein n=1 Tax=Acinetobacter sp. NCu2D-2 TaxID=1608473 RepID=UPI0007CE0752|nr:hypothetical protein [Acinetobacter sp. NCu2D-2]ANF80807.1 hypothetical protein A3K93_00435 [Acinetobacter sp. NCu2D-2]
MKKLILIGLTTLASGIACADQALNVQYGQPAALGTTPNYVSTTVASDQVNNAFTLHGGYTGWKVDSSAIGGKARFHGFHLGSTYDFDQRGVWTKYEHQSDDDFKNEQVSFGGQYTFYNKNNTYALAQAGIGYMWSDLKYSSTDVSIEFDPDTGEETDRTETTTKTDAKARNIFIPVNIELGHYFTPQLAAYAGLGYKWSQNTSIRGTETVGDETTTLKGRSGSLDLHGTSYNFGLKYRF